MSKNHPLCSHLLAPALVLLAACSSSPSNGRARLAVEIVDAPAAQYEEVVVTIAKITAHSTTAGWVTISDTPATLDLLKLKDVGFVFGKVDLAPDKITQIRLYVAPDSQNYVTLADGSHVDLTVPSGVQSGIKINGPFDLRACEETTVTLDFDPAQSIFVHPTGQGDEWILRPVIKAKKVIASEIGCVSTDGDAGTNVIEPPGKTAGSPCTLSSECLSGFCGDNLCGPGAPGTPCLSAADCASATCTEGVCGIGPAVGAGQPCSAPSACLSGVCTNGACEPGLQGTPCVAAADCSTGLTCSAGTCLPSIN